MNPKLQLDIAKPCHESREQMQPTVQGRYCVACNKQAIDFTGMRDKQLVAFFKAPSPVAVSGRFVSDQLGRNIRQPQRRMPWLTYFFQFTLPAFLASAKLPAQRNVKIKRDTTIACEFVIHAERIAKDDSAVLHNAKKLKGRIIDEEGNGLRNVSVTMNSNRRAVVSGKDGHFSISYSDTEKLLLSISMVGYKTKEVAIDSNWNRPILVMLNRDDQMIRGEVVVAGKITAGPAKKMKPAPLIERIMDTAFNYLKVSPNPASAGSGINLEWNKLEEGYYFFQLLNSAGEMVYYREIWIDMQARVMNMELPAVPAGAYYVRLRNKESGKSFSEKLMIQ